MPPLESSEAPATTNAVPDASAALHADSQQPPPKSNFNAFTPGLGMVLSSAEYAVPTAFTSMARTLGNSSFTDALTKSNAMWAGDSAFKRGVGLLSQPNTKLFDDGHLTAFGKESAKGLAKGAGLALAAWGVEYTLDNTVFKNVPEGPLSSAVRWAIVPFALNLSDNQLAATGAAIALDVGSRMVDKWTNGKI